MPLLEPDVAHAALVDTSSFLTSLVLWTRWFHALFTRVALTGWVWVLWTLYVTEMWVSCVAAARFAFLHICVILNRSRLRACSGCRGDPRCARPYHNWRTETRTEWSRKVSIRDECKSHPKSINLLQLHESSKESTNTLFWQNRLDPVWPVWLQLEDANWNRLSLKWDRTLVDWYQARIRAPTSTPSLPSALNTFYQVPRRNKTGPRTHHLGQFVLLPASEDTVARRNRKELDYWCFSTRFQRAKGRLDTQCRSLME